MKWGNAQYDQLKELRESGLSFGQIEKLSTEQFGEALSRNSLISAANRSGLTKPAKPAEKPKAPKPSKTTGIFVLPMAQRRERLENGKLAPGDCRSTRAKPDGFLGVDFMDLEAGMCRWPYGDNAPYLFCGQITQSESSYCPACDHAMRSPRHG